MRVMAIDYGDTRTGVAVSDATGSIIGQSWVIIAKDAQKLAADIAKEAKIREVGVIVIGFPKNMDGSIGSRAEKSQMFSEFLKTFTETEIKLWDERLTTVSAHKILDSAGRFGKKRKKSIDAVAASLILENYLRFLEVEKGNQECNT